jgi:GcrA cell cycle regulator
MSDAQWSDDRVTALSKFWLDGLSASQIAKQLGGVTRNAVIGKVHRLGLSGRVTPSRPARAANLRSARTPRPVRPPSLPRASRQTIAVPPVDVLVESPGLVTSMTGLGAHVCKWPIGDPKAEDFTFCGRAADGVYCARHAQAAYRPGQGQAAAPRPAATPAADGVGGVIAAGGRWPPNGEPGPQA